MTAPDHTDTDRRFLDPLLAGVLTAVSQRHYTARERPWIDRIEQRRRELTARKDTIEYIDFGAGSPNASRSAGEMLAGVPTEQNVGDLTRVASKQPQWAGLLMRIIRETHPQRCIEMGAAAGISTAYQAAALRLNGAGRLISLEGGESIAALAADTLKHLGLDEVAEVRCGRFADILGPTLIEAPPDYVFVDGHHDGPATVAYLDQITAVMQRGVIVFDDIAWSPGMRDAWQEITRATPVAASVDLGDVGVCVVGNRRRPLRCIIVDY